MKPLLAGRRGLILGVANKSSIAWATLKEASNHGAELGATCQNDRFFRRVSKLIEKDDLPETSLWVCDATQPEDLDALFTHIEEELGGLDFILHGWAFAPPDALADDFIETSWEAFQTAQRISAHSLVEIARRARPLMAPGASIVTLSYLGSQRVMPGYNVMGVAKATLESSVRYLARDLGVDAIRVNALSPGPISTLSARGVPGFSKMLEAHADRAPLGRNVTHEEVAQAAVFLFSPMASAITGEIINVDAGYSIMGI